MFKSIWCKRNVEIFKVFHFIFLWWISSKRPISSKTSSTNEWWRNSCLCLVSISCPLSNNKLTIIIYNIHINYEYIKRIWCFNYDWNIDICHFGRTTSTAVATCCPPPGSAWTTRTPAAPSQATGNITVTRDKCNTCTRVTTLTDMLQTIPQVP